MKGCGFHQSDVAHHLYWGLVDWAVEFSVFSVAPPCASFESEAEACLKARPSLHQRGEWQSGSDSCEPAGAGRDGCVCALCWRDSE